MDLAELVKMWFEERTPYGNGASVVSRAKVPTGFAIGTRPSPRWSAETGVARKIVSECRKLTVPKGHVSIVKEYQLAVSFEGSLDLPESKGMKEIIVIQEDDYGSSGSSNPIDKHGPQVTLAREHPSSVLSDVAFEAIIAKIRGNNQFNWWSAREPHGGKRFLEKFSPTPGGYYY